MMQKCQIWFLPSALALQAVAVKEDKKQNTDCYIKT